MNAYTMRAFTVDGELYPFNMSSIPTKITDTEFILALEPGSPILLLDNITRGMDIPGIFEGDILLEDGKRYVINYTRGFSAVGEDREVKQLYEFKQLNRVETIFDTHFPFEIKLRKKMTFKYRDFSLRLQDFIGSYKNFAVVKGVNDRLDPSEIQQEAGFTHKGARIFFGDLIDGYPVELWYGRPVLITNEGIYDIINKQYISTTERSQILC